MASRVKSLFSLLFLVGLAGLSGCIFSPDRKDPVPPPSTDQYRYPKSPQYALWNLVTAYVARDSVQTAAVYDDLYEGTATDPSLPNPIPTFSKADEVRHVGRLKLDPNIVSVLLDLGNETSWQVLDASPSDPPGWKTIQISSQTVRIEDIAIATTWESENHIIEYTFKPNHVANASADEDTIWTVRRWTEFAN